MASGKDSHAYSSIPLEDIFTAPDRESNGVPSTPPPEFEAGRSNLNPTRLPYSDHQIEISNIYRRINEIHEVLASLKSSTGGVDPESLVQTPVRTSDIECTPQCLKNFVIVFIVILLGLTFFVTFATLLSLWYSKHSS
ncbi:hypothetical protein DFJ63DRAFT_314878 [Scheffersomyces coipomensis]|uniref:uncharacterized protein n=1 Tax=Scheffersomyces coipomensis TaxID=1788519 RepID=UPI00315D2663